jgi:hypothetical protein
MMTVIEMRSEIAGGVDPDGCAGGAAVLPRGINRGGEVSP